MKNIFRSYTSFTRTERMGIVALLLLILVLIIVKATMHLWVHPAEVELQQVTIHQKNEASDRGIQNAKQPATSKLNLNTADSLQLVALPGIGKGLSHRILAQRRKLGRFTNMEQVFDVYKFKQETREMLLNRTVIE